MHASSEPVYRTVNSTYVNVLFFVFTFCKYNLANTFTLLIVITVFLDSLILYFFVIFFTTLDKNDFSAIVLVDRRYCAVSELPRTNITSFERQAGSSSYYQQKGFAANLDRLTNINKICQKLPKWISQQVVNVPSNFGVCVRQLCSFFSAREECIASDARRLFLKYTEMSFTLNSIDDLP